MIGQKTYDRACDWIILLDSDTVTAEVRADFVRWLNREPGNAIAFEEMSQLWARIDTLGAPAENTDELFPLSPAHLRPAARSRNFTQWVMASLLAIVVLCGAIIFGNPTSGALTEPQFVTALNQNHRLVAVDGTVMELGPLSAITLNYSPLLREVQMHRGEVEFTVARDEALPFVVRIGNSSIRALGTQFSVKADSASIEVQVTEGRVQFDSEASPASSGNAARAPATLILPAGQSMKFAIESKTFELQTESVPVN